MFWVWLILWLLSLFAVGAICLKVGYALGQDEANAR
jgi:hypothetical protein